MIVDKKTYREYCLADNLANSREVSLCSKIMQILYPNHIWSFLNLLRKTEYLKNCKKGIFWNLSYQFFNWRFKKVSMKLGFSIPLNVFGAGLSIPHYGTIIVNSASQIGKNCRLHACVNIGASGGSSFAPKIGDNVYIGPGAILFGNILIADNVSIAANATVNKSIETPSVTIGGTPAKIIIENSTVWWVKNRLDLF